MKKEIGSIIKNLENILTGQPWYGRAVIELLDEVNPKTVNEKPGGSDHSLLELLYHMNTWTEFTLNRLRGDRDNDLAASEALDWRKIDPKKHSWKKGMTEFKRLNRAIITVLKTKDDDFLKEIVDYRKYNYRFLLHGMMQHHIYHIGQIAYINKLLS